MCERSISVCNLAYRASVSPNYISYLRYGRSDPTRGMMVKITDAVRGMVGRRVAISELFDLGD
jgi:predicted transcriptional regulator